MTSRFRLTLLAATVFALPAAGALAQTNNPGESGGTRGSMIAPQTYPPGTASNPALSTGKLPAGAAGVPAAHNPNVAGATGHTIVPGNNSSVAADRRGTVEQKTGETGSSGGGK